MYRKFRKSKEKKEEGFSLIEVVVVMFFMIILTSVTVFNYRDFDTKIELKNQALEIALNIREAQVNALSTRGSDMGSNDPTTFQYAYGVFFDLTESTSSFIYYVNNSEGTTQEDFWFNDASWSCGGDECIMKYTLRPGYTITEVCTTEATETCSSNGAVSISFLRPDPDAIIRKTAVLGTPQQSAKIKVSSPGDKVKYINVTQAGQIYVN